MHVVTIPGTPPAPRLRLAHVARFDAPGMSAGARRLGDWEFFAVLTGSTWLEAATGGRVAMPAGSVGLIPPGLVFDWGLDRHSHLAVHFDLQPGAEPASGADITYLPDTIANGWARTVPNWTLRCGSTAQAVPLVRSGESVVAWTERCAPLLRLWSRGGAHSLADRLRSSGIIATALADWLAADAGRGGVGPAIRIHQLIDELATAPADAHHGIPQLARRCRMGEGAFRRAFRSATGLSPRRWLERRRIEAVLDMLSNPRVAVAHAAHIAGYDDPFHFARVVRRVTGRPPSALRRNDG